jgi:glucosamine--fructose-6-phosphate aminotransferase (isomerizing)
MCGIVGYIGHREAEAVLLHGLRRLENRYYDSAGLATLTGPGRMHVRKRAGRVADLAVMLRERPAPGCVGVGHMRWATHGPATDVNAHPHLGGDGVVAVVHNGFIENHAALRRRLLGEGVVFESDCDSEVIAQLIARRFEGDLVDAVTAVLPLLRGTYALAVVSPEDPDVLVGARLGRPLVLGAGADEYFLASDPAALVGLTDQVVHLQDHQVCVLTPEDWRVLDCEERCPIDAAQAVERPSSDAGKGAFQPHLLQEIHEQPERLADALRGRFDQSQASAHFEGVNLTPRQLRKVDRLILTGCGASFHSAVVGKHLIEEIARLPVEVEYAGEFRYREPAIDRNTLVVAITQSGETADTLAAMRESKRKGRPTLALCNVVGGAIAAEADSAVYLRAGPQIGATSTKAFTSQVLTLALLALYLGRLRALSASEGARMLEEFRSLPDAARRALACEVAVRRLAEKYARAKSFLFLGRGAFHPAALEGALKLAEVSSVHAEGCSPAAWKNGPPAWVDSATPSVVLAPRGPHYERTLADLEEIKARGGPVIVAASEGDNHAAERGDEVIFIPAAPLYLQPLLAVIPLQLLAYHIGRLRGCALDDPRPLATNVPVE